MSTEQGQKMRNEKLCGLLKDLTESFVNALDKAFYPNYGSTHDRIKALLQANPELVAKILEVRPDLEEKKLSCCILSAKKSIEALQGENICRNSPHASMVEGYRNELLYFLDRMIDQRDRIRASKIFSEEGFKAHFNRIFHEEYLRYEQYLYNASACDYLIGPLRNFISSRNIEFDSQATIRKITQNEFHSLVEAEESKGNTLDSYPEFVIHVPLNAGEWQESIKQVITSSRLLKNGKTGLSRVYYAYALPFRPWKIFDALEGTKFVETSKKSFFKIDSSQEVELKRIFVLLIRAKEVGYLVMALRRFNLANERERIEDSWIDLFVSLESLYSTASEMTEITHRLATSYPYFDSYS
jgi:hypothetical protein